MKTKICSKCKIRKELDEFYKDKRKNNKYRTICKLCCKNSCKKYYLNNKKHYKKQHKKYYNENKIKILKINKITHKNNKKLHQYKYTLKNIKQRCNNLNNVAFKYYGGRGIKCLITESELKFLWERDKAYEMKKPSIDRIDNNENYCLENCRYIEQSENTKRRSRNTLEELKKRKS